MNLERIKKLLFSNIELGVIITLLFAITSVNTLVFDYRFNEIAWLFIASLSGGLLAKVWRGNTGKINYLHNGDGMVAIFGIIASMVLFPTGDASIAFIICLGTLIIFRAFLLITDLASFTGFFTNIAVLAACGYLIHRFDISLSPLYVIATGAFRAIICSQWLALTVLLLAGALYIPAISLRYEIRLFALGRDFFEEIGYRYRPVLFALEGMRCILTTAAVLGSGVFSAAGMIFTSFKRKENVLDYATAPLIIALVVQSLAMLQAISGSAAASIVAVCAAILWPYIAGRFSND